MASDAPSALPPIPETDPVTAGESSPAAAETIQEKVYC